MLKVIAIIFGLIMLAIGILGFIPSFNQEGLLLGIFHVNLIHNAIHIATGVIALLCGLSGENPSRVFFRIFGIVYAIVAVLGFYYGNEDILGLVANNPADNWLHVGISVVSLFLGFGCCSSCKR